MKLEITDTGLLVIETPMGLFQIHETNRGISLVFVAPGELGKEVFSASHNPGAEFVLRHPTISTKLATRVAAYIDGPRMGKAAKPIAGTISREEFIEAYMQYRLRGGNQDVEQLLNGGGFSLVEFDFLLGRQPHSWIEDKLKVPAALIEGKDKLEVLRSSKDELEALPQEDKLEDRANPVLLTAEFATITPKDKLEDPTTIESTGVMSKDKLEDRAPD